MVEETEERGGGVRLKYRETVPDVIISHRAFEEVHKLFELFLSSLWSLTFPDTPRPPPLFPSPATRPDPSAMSSVSIHVRAGGWCFWGWDSFAPLDRSGRGHVGVFHMFFQWFTPSPSTPPLPPFLYRSSTVAREVSYERENWGGPFPPPPPLPPSPYHPGLSVGTRSVPIDGLLAVLSPVSSLNLLWPICS